jgi:hypothetical protein
VLTETAGLSAALLRAAARWPEDRDRPARLLARLAQVGSEAIADDAAERARSRRDAIARAAGSLTGIYASGELEAMRREWPA